MKHLILTIICNFVVLATIAQSIDTVQLGQSTTAIFQTFDHPSSPGIAVTVLKDGRPITKKKYGMANLEHSIPFTHKSPVRLLYSMGREFMSIGLVLMETDGLLSFDDKVRNYFPKLPEWSKDVTIRDLINHSSGFNDEWSLLLLMTADMRSNIEEEQVLSLLYNQPQPQVEPGKGYMYNNTDFALLRLIMEMAAEKSLIDYLNEKVFTPLGMSSTFMNDDIEALIPGFAENYYGYKTFRKARFIKHSPGGNYRIVTTADDLQKWAMAINDTSSAISKGFSRLYKNTRPIPVLQSERHYTFGHVFGTINGTEIIYHGGVEESYYLIRIPAKQISVIGLGNGLNFYSPIVHLAHSLFPPEQDAQERRYFPQGQVLLNKEDMVKYTGRYFAQDVGYNSHIPSIEFYDLKLEGDKLNFYAKLAAEGFPITSFGNGYFKDLDDDTMMQFIEGEPDSVMKLKIWQEGRNKSKIFIREESKVNFTKDYLQQFIGKYYSPHLDYYFSIVMNEKGQLILKRPTVPNTYMEPTSEERFLIEQKNGGYSTFVRMIFTKNEKDEVDGFSLQYSRLMHHRFEKVQ